VSAVRCGGRSEAGVGERLAGLKQECGRTRGGLGEGWPVRGGSDADGRGTDGAWGSRSEISVSTQKNW
jgi:hypothetical protein